MLLKNCRLIPALSAGHAGLFDIRLQNGRIAAILPTGQPAEADTLDLQGKTLLPGLIDLHTHVLVLQGRYKPTDTINPMKLLAKTCDATREFLDHGFTTIRECGSPLRVANVLRDMIHKGLVEGPRIISCGLIVTPTECELDNSLAAINATADGADEVRRAVRREVAEGADFVKCYASGSALYPEGTPMNPIAEFDELATAVRIAAMKGKKVAAHAHSDSSIRDCVNAGVYTIEHATYISDETLKLVADRGEECYLVPTLAAMHVSNASPDPNEFWNVRLGTMLRTCAVGVRKAYEMDLQLGFGTDSAAGGEQYNQGLEFKFRKEHCHMDNVDILRQATIINAKILGMDNKLGLIQEGYIADLIAVDGAPDEDISCMYCKPALVFKDGKLVRTNP